MNKDDLQRLSHAKKKIKSGKIKKIYIASNRRGNNVGVGSLRTVLLATVNGKDWFQYYKFWNGNHRERAENFMKEINRYKREYEQI